MSSWLTLRWHVFCAEILLKSIECICIIYSVYLIIIYDNTHNMNLICKIYSIYDHMIYIVLFRDSLELCQSTFPRAYTAHTEKPLAKSERWS